jgi:hypothetical protein
VPEDGQALGASARWTTMRCRVEPGGWQANRVAV